MSDDTIIKLAAFAVVALLIICVTIMFIVSEKKK